MTKSGFSILAYFLTSTQLWPLNVSSDLKSSLLILEIKCTISIKIWSDKAKIKCKELQGLEFSLERHYRLPADLTTW